MLSRVSFPSAPSHRKPLSARRGQSAAGVRPPTLTAAAMVLGGYSKLRAQLPERRTSLLKTVCLSIALVSLLYVLSPARSDFNQYVLNDNTVACKGVGCKPVDLRKILMTKSGTFPPLQRALFPRSCACARRQPADRRRAQRSSSSSSGSRATSARTSSGAPAGARPTFRSTSRSDLCRSSTTPPGARR